MAPNLKDKVEDGEIDLSMCDLREVPVKEIAFIKNVYSLDLSNNHLVSLPKNFALLTHLTKLDLSKNALKELPENFGDLIKLRYLDLYKNELNHLPLSFAQLKSLKWLDLKDNLLVPAIRDMAGPCLDAKQCQICAKNIVQLYTNMQLEVETEREAREKQRQKNKQQANVLAAQKLKQEKKSKKNKDKVKNKANGEALQEELSIIDQVARGEWEEKIKRYKNKEISFAWLFAKLFLTLAIVISITLFVLTSVKLEHTEFIETKVKEIWNECIEKAPPSIQFFGNNFAHHIKNLHSLTGERCTSLAAYLQELIKKYN